MGKLPLTSPRRPAVLNGTRFPDDNLDDKAKEGYTKRTAPEVGGSHDPDRFHLLLSSAGAGTLCATTQAPSHRKDDAVVFARTELSEGRDTIHP